MVIEPREMAIESWIESPAESEQVGTEPEPAAETSADGSGDDAEETPAEPKRRWARLPFPRRSPKPPIVAARSHLGDAARDLVAAKARARATGPAPEPTAAAAAAADTRVQAATPEPGQTTEPAEPLVDPAAEPVEKPAKVSKHDQVAEEMPGVYTFAPKRTARRVLNVAMLAGLGACVYFVRLAVQSKDTATIGLAAIVVLATAIVWAIRAGASMTRMSVHYGQLEVVQQGGRFIFDIASEYTQMEVHGVPGKPGWKVLFPRRGMPPFTVDASMVDPDDFMRVLRFFKPELVKH
jgi:hypothetical protein